MRQKCEYCGNWIDDTDAVCPHCGGPNANMMVSAEGVPKTIDELKAFCEQHNLPLKDMRFFIGENYEGARAFGIYQDGTNFIVYKNKADGSRAVRYRGKDEAYAVNEIYQKMKSEIANQRSHNARQGTPQQKQPQKKQSQKKKKFRLPILPIVIGFLVLGFVACVAFLPDIPSRGYYSYNDTNYYYQNDYWYYYDVGRNSWERSYDTPSELTEDFDNYYNGYSYDSSFATSDFMDSDYYEPSYSSSSDSSSDDGWSWTDWDDDWDDDDWDWSSSDTWDSGYTDWDSDW